MTSCCLHDSPNTIELLLAAGAGVNIQDEVRKLIPAKVLKFCFLSCIRKFENCVEHTYTAGADPGFKKGGHTEAELRKFEN